MYGSWVWEGGLGGRVGVLAGILSIAWVSRFSSQALQRSVLGWDWGVRRLLSISQIEDFHRASVQLTHFIAQHVEKMLVLWFRDIGGVKRTA